MVHLNGRDKRREAMFKCPFCNQPMDELDPGDHMGSSDLYICGACQVEHAVYWQHGDGAHPLEDEEK